MKSISIQFIEQKKWKKRASYYQLLALIVFVTGLAAFGIGVIAEIWAARIIYSASMVLLCSAWLLKHAEASCLRRGLGC